MYYKSILIIVCIISFLNVNLNGQAYPDRHSTGLNDGWLSCQTSQNPNPARGNSHWIMYNFGDTYTLTTSTIWNFNTPERINSYNNESWSIQPLQGKLEDGIKDVVIDLSIDGINWIEHGRFTIPKAPGSSFYQGVFGPDFGGKIARYVLITAINNHGGSCYGLGEVRIMATVATTGVNNALADADIKVFPNPFSEITTVTLSDFPLGEVELSVKDLTGKLLKDMTVNVKNEKEQIQLHAANWPNGLYLLQAIQNDATKTIKIEIIK